MGPAATPDTMHLLSQQLRRVHIGEYHRMIEAGVFDDDERAELLEGVIVSVSPQGADHALMVERLCDPAFVNLPTDFVVRCQLPLSLSDGDEPEPDVAVIGRDIPRSRREQPTTARLIYEVASESLRKDREVKAPLYARSGIPEYVIVNIKDECLEVHRDPDPVHGVYRTLETLTRERTFSSASVPGLTFSVADLFA